MRLTPSKWVQNYSLNNSRWFISSVKPQVHFGGVPSLAVLSINHPGCTLCNGVGLGRNFLCHRNCPSASGTAIVQGEPFSSDWTDLWKQWVASRTAQRTKLSCQNNRKGISESQSLKGLGEERIKLYQIQTSSSPGMQCWPFTPGFAGWVWSIDSIYCIYMSFLKSAKNVALSTDLPQVQSMTPVTFSILFLHLCFLYFDMFAVYFLFFILNYIEFYRLCFL